MDSYTGPRACAEWEISISGSRPLAVQPTLRLKLLRILPKIWMSVQVVCADQYERTSRQWQSADRDIGRRLALYNWCGRVQTERFIEYGSSIREVLQVVVGVRHSSLENLVQFLMKSCLR